MPKGLQTLRVARFAAPCEQLILYTTNRGSKKKPTPRKRGRDGESMFGDLDGPPVNELDPAQPQHLLRLKETVEQDINRCLSDCFVVAYDPA